MTRASVYRQRPVPPDRARALAPRGCRSVFETGVLQLKREERRTEVDRVASRVVGEFEVMHLRRRHEEQRGRANFITSGVDHVPPMARLDPHDVEEVMPMRIRKCRLEFFHRSHVEVGRLDDGSVLEMRNPESRQ